MSGLAALIGDGARAEAAAAMLDAAPHRGPVRAVYEGPGFALAVQQHDDAPDFVSAGLAHDGRGAVAFVGCVYRGPEIVAGARAAERALAMEHDDLPALRGAYAAVAVDASGGGLAVRSACGERPLFWRQRGGLVMLASEIKQLRAAPGPVPALDHEALMDRALLDRGGRETSWADIHRLIGGDWLRVNQTGVSTGRGWSARRAAAKPLRISLPEAGTRFRSLLGQSVARRLGPGTCLLMSGGIDSTAIAVEAARLSRERFDEPLTVVSGLFPQHASADESAYIADTVRALGLVGLTERPRPHPFAEIDAQMALHDGPSVVAVPGNLDVLLDAARAAGRPAALDGNDGDSLFGLRTGLERALMRRAAVRPLAGVVRRAHEEGLGWGRAIRRHLVAPLVPSTAIRRGLGHRHRAGEEIPPWLTGPLRRRALDLMVPARPPSWRAAQAAMYDGQIEALLETLERIALSRSTTLLHPLADVDLVEFFLSLPPEVKFAGGEGKAVARRSFPELPRSVSRRAYKPHFDDVSAGGVDGAELAAAIAAGPRALPGVEWDELRRRAGNSTMSGSEVAMAVRALQADHLLAAG